MASAPRTRTLRVDDVDYGWVTRYADPGHVVVRVWRATHKRGCLLEVLVPFDDPWLNYGPLITAVPDRVAESFALAPVTPRLVEKVIRAALLDGWQPADRGAPMRLVLDRDQVITRG